MKKKNQLWILIILILLIVMILLGILYHYNYIPHRKYNNEDFAIQTYRSKTDQDGDGVDDQSDILNSALAYTATKPKYKSKYYQSGYPEDEYGVCTDVVAFALLGAGYDLQMLVEDDIKAHLENYDIEEPDSNIDFRRVRNLNVYFQDRAISLTTDPKKLSEWQGGDIVVFQKHIGIVSDHRNRKGISFIIHHGNPMQTRYEEDVLENYGEIVGHYRIS